MHFILLLVFFFEISCVIENVFWHFYVCKDSKFSSRYLANLFWKRVSESEKNKGNWKGEKRRENEGISKSSNFYLLIFFQLTTSISSIINMPAHVLVHVAIISYIDPWNPFMTFCSFVWRIHQSRHTNRYHHHHQASCLQLIGLVRWTIFHNSTYFTAPHLLVCVSSDHS